MWVHSRYRSEAGNLLEIEDVGKWQAAFTKFHNKMKSHSEFEDGQLFKFFVGHRIGNQDKFQELMKQHEDVRAGQEILDGLAKLQTEPNEDLKKDVLRKMKNYVKDLEEHLDMEEKTVVGPWLQLTAEQYKVYRSYLSWKYCFMY